MAFHLIFFLGGVLDSRNFHLGCPVVYGNKWIANKWVHWIPQMWNYQCHLNGKPFPIYKNWNFFSSTRPDKICWIPFKCSLLRAVFCIISCVFSPMFGCYSLKTLVQICIFHIFECFLSFNAQMMKMRWNECWFSFFPNAGWHKKSCFTKFFITFCSRKCVL